VDVVLLVRAYPIRLSKTRIMHILRMRFGSQEFWLGPIKKGFSIQNFEVSFSIMNLTGSVTI
jgi:hypothetical protein